MKDTRLFLGVDGGQTSTTALVGDDCGNVLGAAVGGPCNHVRAEEGEAKFKQMAQECVSEACRQAGLDPAVVIFESACFGMSGGPDDKSVLLADVLRCRRLLVTDDATIALSGALGGKPGVVVIAGTGSIALGRNAEGVTARAGGWGYIYGDEGGAFNIVRQALRAALRYEEGWGEPTNLKEAFLRHAGYKTTNDLLHAFYTVDWPRSRVAGMAPLVSQVAEEGDSVALEILNKAAGDLADFVRAVSLQLWGPLEFVAVSFVGGVFRGAILRARFQCLIPAAARPLLDPAGGALLEAYHAAGASPDLDKLLTSKL